MDSNKMMFKLAESINEKTIKVLIDSVPLFMHGIAYYEAEKIITDNEDLEFVELVKYAILLGYIYAKAENRFYLEEIYSGS